MENDVGHLAYLCACALAISMSLVLIGHKIMPPPDHMTPLAAARPIGDDLTPQEAMQ